jgi:hypothetical protein
MRGPIDFIIVGFKGNTFDGSILKTLLEASKKGIISILGIAIIRKDKDGEVTLMNASQSGDSLVVDMAKQLPASKDIIGKEDIDETADLLQNDTAAGLLIVEQLWAKPLKKALMDANGELIADGRIHPEAAMELNS